MTAEIDVMKNAIYIIKDEKNKRLLNLQLVTENR
jgi:hypothetical protein